MALRALTLRARISVLVLVTTIAALLVFAIAAFVVIVIAERAENPDLTTSEVLEEVGSGVLTAMAIAGPLALLIALGGAYWLGRRALAPLEAVIRSARDVSARDLGRRLDVPEARDEMRELVLAQNALFARLEEGFGGLARFAADASHELRTPVAAVVNELEVSLRRPRTTDEWRDTATRSLEELRRLNRLIEALLVLARVEAPAEPPRGSSLERSLEFAHARFAPDAARRGVELAFVSPAWLAELHVAIGEEPLAIALANLVANATRHASKRVDVAVERCEPSETSERPMAWIHVDDDGAGVLEADAERIFDAFGRGTLIEEDPARSGGVGLGLTIARRVIERHGGALVVGRAPAGGARFSMSVPVVESGP